jgi:ubiquinone/menaquinone biosynthesis C-methylase UbiE
VNDNQAQSEQNQFYRALEERFHGSGDLTRSRLQEYRRFVEPLSRTLTDLKAVDLGCGRGDFLEFLREIGVDAEGVDLNDAMLAACQEAGLKVTKADALTFLRSLPSESYGLVTAFHTIQNISFGEVRSLISEAFRVLCPGGILILETPSPEDLFSPICLSNLDQTQVKSIAPELLSFLFEYSGFKRMCTVITSEQHNTAKELYGGEHSFRGMRAEYAVVGQKAGAKALLTVLDKAFDAKQGILLQQQVEALDDKIVWIVDELRTVRERLDSERAKREGQEKRLKDLLSSHSWRWTAPGRAILLLFRDSFRRTGERARFGALRVGRFVITKPLIAKMAKQLVRPLPTVATERLRIVFLGPQPIESDISNLSPRAREIYTQLLATPKLQNRVH